MVSLEGKYCPSGNERCTSGAVKVNRGCKISGRLLSTTTLFVGGVIKFRLPMEQLTSNKLVGVQRIDAPITFGAASHETIS